MKNHLDDHLLIKFLSGKLPRGKEDVIMDHLVSCRKCRENLALFIQVSNTALNYEEERLLAEIFPESMEDYTNQIVHIMQQHYGKQKLVSLQKLKSYLKVKAYNGCTYFYSIFKQRRVAIPSIFALMAILLIFVNPLGNYLDYKASHYIKTGNELLVKNINPYNTLPLRPYGSFPWVEFRVFRGGLSEDIKNQGELLKNYYDNALALRSLNPKIISSVGNFYLLIGDFKYARILFNKALQLEPENKIAANGMGILYFKENKFELAIKNFSIAKKSDPNFIEARYNLAYLYQCSGDYNKAEKEIHEYLQIDSTSKWAENARKMLSKIQ
jgi:tetratricopeptide (TPR) repeat protein